MKYAIITLDNEIDRLLELPLIRRQYRKRDRAIKTLSNAIDKLEGKPVKPEIKRCYWAQENVEDKKILEVEVESGIIAPLYFYRHEAKAACNAFHRPVKVKLVRVGK